MREFEKAWQGLNDYHGPSSPEVSVALATGLILETFEEHGLLIVNSTA
jgi:hypothetical protein